MSKGVGPGRPPAGGRFRKGESGNPKGRPKKQRPPPSSAFDIVMDRTLTVTQGGVARELSFEEALQLRTYQDAIAGKRLAQREVWRWIAKREKWLEARRPAKHRSVEHRLEPEDPNNANEAMLLLDIAGPDATWGHLIPNHQRIKLQTWAVQAALSRPGRRQLKRDDILEIERCTHEPHLLRWPKGTRND